MKIEQPPYFHSNGKVLLTGEYFVLQGAKSLAMPIKTGQSLLQLQNTAGSGVEWITRYQGKEVLTLKFSETLEIEACRPKEFNTDFLLRLLQAARAMNPEKWAQLNGSCLIADIEFAHNWGLGSSSSLISNIAWLFNLDPFRLHFAVSNGSGYDIACARSKQAIIYQLFDKQPIIKETTFCPDFHNELYFVYLGQKQDSAAEVSRFLKHKTVSPQDIQTIGELTEAFLQAASGSELGRVIREHEKLLSSHLGMKPVKQQYFSGFEGDIKSLGAWGGDLALVCWNQGEERLRSYFAGKNLHQLMRFNELISC